MASGRCSPASPSPGQDDIWRSLNLRRPETLVHDGDTLHVLCGQHTRKLKIRLYCMDAPELAQAPWGGEARDPPARPSPERPSHRENHREGQVPALRRRGMEGYGERQPS